MHVVQVVRVVTKAVLQRQVVSSAVVASAVQVCWFGMDGHGEGGEEEDEGWYRGKGEMGKVSQGSEPRGRERADIRQSRSRKLRIRYRTLLG